MARHQTNVSLFRSSLPNDIRCETWPDLTSHTRILSIPPVTITSSSLCQAIDSILAR